MLWQVQPAELMLLTSSSEDASGSTALISTLCLRPNRKFRMKPRISSGESLEAILARSSSFGFKRRGLIRPSLRRLRGSTAEISEDGKSDAASSSGKSASTPAALPVADSTVPAVVGMESAKARADPTEHWLRQLRALSSAPAVCSTSSNLSRCGRWPCLTSKCTLHPSRVSLFFAVRRSISSIIVPTSPFCWRKLSNNVSTMLSSPSS
mmetsp:Transcript_35152/g.81026  ORF Transcript_35152/g.81026 Transcript_35152/m.81026 type:complete len:209 (-) Transcript_35152:334-960(-)